MNYKFGTILKIEGALLMVLAGCMVPSFLIAVAESETASIRAFGLVIIFCVSVGFILYRRFKSHSRKNLKSRDGFLVVALGWTIASVAGATPFMLSGSMPNFFDALFESVSGFTTTGSSILTDVEVLPRSDLFWRSFTHWIGGMGIIVFITAILPAFGINGQIVANAETTGPTKDKVAAKFSDNSKGTYSIYVVMTLIQTLLLKVGGMSWFDSLVHTFGTVGTGGFSVYNKSIAHYDNAYFEIIIAVFMFLSAVNFNLYFLAVKKRSPLEVLRDDEAKFYIWVTALATGLIAVYNFIVIGLKSFGETLLDAFFQVSSILTTTGYWTDDYDVWPTFSKMILFSLFFIGGCTSSTAGGIKCIRVRIGIKMARMGISQKIHPSRVTPLTVNGKEISNSTAIRISNFIFTYILVLLIGTLLVSFDGHDFMTNLSAAGTCLGNIGPGFNVVGPTMNFAFYSNFAKFVCSALMIIGRLEIYTVLLLFTRNYWNDNRVR